MSLIIIKRIVASLGEVASEILVGIGSGNDFLSDGTEPLPETMLTAHQCGIVAFSWLIAQIIGSNFGQYVSVIKGRCCAGDWN